jgi:drug/metabolite transporter (DMT)-like permease
MGGDALLFAALGAMIVMGAANFAIYKVMFNAYGTSGAYFVSQGVNVLYVAYGGFCLGYKMYFTNEIDAEMRKGSHKKFIVMGTLDCMGTFLTAMGAVYTPGTFQTLLNQTLIPFTLIFSRAFLGASYPRLQIVGALAIMLGACISIGPAVLHPTDLSTNFRWYSCLIYFLSNAPMALSSVFKEYAFTNEKVDLFYLCQWVSIYQLLVGFLFAPLQVIPGFGTAKGVPLEQIPVDFMKGLWCYLQMPPPDATLKDDGYSEACAEQHCFLLLSGYVLINFIFNALGLYLTKHGSATLKSVAYAILLPITTVTFSLPFMGSYRESLTPFTWIGLIAVLAGFGLFRCAETPLPAGPDEPPTPSPANIDPTMTPKTKKRVRQSISRRQMRREKQRAQTSQMHLHERLGGMDILGGAVVSGSTRSSPMERIHRPRSTSQESNAWIGLRIDPKSGQTLADSSNVTTAMYPQQKNARQIHNRSHDSGDGGGAEKRDQSRLAAAQSKKGGAVELRAPLLGGSGAPAGGEAVARGADYGAI